MSFCIEKGDELAVFIQSEHEEFTWDDADLFYRTLDGVLTYANERLRLVERDKVTLCSESREELDDGGRVSDRLWLDRALVGEYVERNPYEVPEEQLDVAAPWRYALRDVFIIVRAAEDHILAMNRDALFCVERLEAPADRHVRAVPSLALLTLLPFKGAIVTDSKFIHLEDEMDPSLIGNIRESAHEFAHSGVVSGADALVRYSRELPDANRVPESWQRQLDEVLGLPHVPGITA